MNMQLFKNIDNLILSKNLDDELALPFIEINFEHLFLFYGMIHKSNRRKYYTEMRKVLKSLNPEIYTPVRLSILNESLREKIRKVQKYNYVFGKIKDFLYKKQISADCKKIKICNLTIYKSSKEGNKKVRTYLKCIKFKEK